MTTEQKLQLIDGCFTVSESREVLMNIFESKIHFHQMKNFSSQERLGIADETALQRIPRLKNSLKELSHMLSAAEHLNAKLEIKADVLIRFVTHQKTD